MSQPHTSHSGSHAQIAYISIVIHVVSTTGCDWVFLFLRDLSRALDV